MKEGFNVLVFLLYSVAVLVAVGALFWRVCT